MNYPPPIPGLLIGALVVAVVCAIECWIFVGMYRRTEKTAEGRHLFRNSVILGLMFSLTVLFQFLGTDYYVVLVASVIQLLVFLAAAAELWVRITLLREARRRAAGKNGGIEFNVTKSPDHSGDYNITPEENP